MIAEYDWGKVKGKNTEDNGVEEIVGKRGSQWLYSSEKLGKG